MDCRGRGIGRARLLIAVSKERSANVSRRVRFVEPTQDAVVKQECPALQGYVNASKDARQPLPGTILHIEREDCDEYDYAGLAEFQEPEIPATPEQQQRFQMLENWRQLYSQIKGILPEDVLSTATLKRLAYGLVPYTKDSLCREGVSEAILNVQSTVLLAILNDLDDFPLERIRRTQCRNCILFGHMANICPYPANFRRRAEWRKVHPEQGKRLLARRPVKRLETEAKRRRRQ